MKRALITAMTMTAFLCGCTEMTDSPSGLAPGGFAGDSSGNSAADAVSPQSPVQTQSAQDGQSAVQQQTQPEAVQQTEVQQGTDQPPLAEETPAAVTQDAPVVPAPAPVPPTPAPPVQAADPGDVFAGTYSEPEAGRGVLTIVNSGDNTYSVNVTWHDSAACTYLWELSGEFDGRACLHYNNCTKKLINADTGSTDIVYEYGTGYIQVKEDGQVFWSDFYDGTEYSFMKTY